MNDYRVALVGAYERDNFGDLLFSYITDYFLHDFETILTSPLRGSVNHLTPKEVLDYREVFRSVEPIDAVWTVGGMLGGAKPSSAIGHYPGKAPGGVEGLESPYIPRMSQYSKLHNVPFVVNSCSIGNLGTSLQGSRVKQALSEASLISVRDRSSQRALDFYGVPSNAAPDIVHALKRVVPAGGKQDIILVQFAKHYFDLAHQKALAKWLVTSEALQGSHIILWAAGVAPGHDSIEQYRQIVNHAAQINPKVQISVSEERNPLEIAKMISSAKLSISSSLHARIVASAYNIPRISWKRPKLQDYCSDWDNVYPDDATLENIESRCAGALALPDTRSGNVLAAKAEKNVLNLVTKLHQLLEAPDVNCGIRRLQGLNQYVRESQLIIEKINAMQGTASRK